MRKRPSGPVFLLTIIIFVMTIMPVQIFAQPGVSAQCFVLVESETGTVLLEGNADSRMLIASTTKIMTALVVIENCDLEEVLSVKQEYTLVEGSSMYLKPGERLTVESVLYGLMLSSGNDAAVALACHTAGSVEAFAQLMNKKAKELGMTNSSFKNPHGLDADGHYSTAKDMAILTVEAMHNPEFAEIVSTKTINVAGRSLTNHNKLLWKYDGALGVKTGYTKSAGRSLVSCAERDGMQLVCVTLNAPDDWDDHSALYDWAFANYRYERPVEKGQVIVSVPMISGLSDEVDIVADESAGILLDKDDSIEVVVNAPKFVYAGVEINRGAGSISVIVNGESVQDIGLSFEGDIRVDDSERLTFWEQVRWGWYRVQKFSILSALGGRNGAKASKSYF